MIPNYIAIVAGCVLIISGCGQTSSSFTLDGGSSGHDAVSSPDHVVGDWRAELAAKQELPLVVPEWFSCPPAMEPCVFCKDASDCTGVFIEEGPCADAKCDSESQFCALEYAEQGKSCADDNLCNGDETCQPIVEEMHCVAGEALVCDDPNPCMDGTCNDGEGCVYEAIEGCVPPLALCRLSGVAGQQVDCPLLMVRLAENVKIPSGADFTLSWSGEAAVLATMEDETCLGAVCLPKEIPQCDGDGLNCNWGTLYPSGHAIIAVPDNMADWGDHITLLFFHLTDPYKPLAEAFLADDGSVVGDDAEFLRARFTLLADIPDDQPEILWMSDFHFSLATGETLAAEAVETPLGPAMGLY